MKSSVKLNWKGWRNGVGTVFFWSNFEITAKEEGIRSVGRNLIANFMERGGVGFSVFGKFLVHHWTVHRMQSSLKIRQREFRTAGKLGLRVSRETHIRMGSRCPDSPRWQKPNCLPEQFSNKLERVLLTFRSHFKSIIFSYRLGFQKNNKEKGETIFILEFESGIFNRGINSGSFFQVFRLDSKERR